METGLVNDAEVINTLENQSQRPKKGIWGGATVEDSIELE